MYFIKVATKTNKEVCERQRGGFGVRLTIEWKEINKDKGGFVL